MTHETVQAIYRELDSLSVNLKQSPELGLMYYRERLLECRQKQDRISEILVLINRELSVARSSARALTASVEVVGQGEAASMVRRELKRELQPFTDTEDILKYLLSAARLRRENLRATSSDIRLMVNIIEQQLKLGEVQPPKESSRRQPQDVPLPFDGGSPAEVSFDATPPDLGESEWPDVSGMGKVKKQPKVHDETLDLDRIF